MDATFKGILETYTYRNNKGNSVLCWDLGKYVNHSFKSNCLGTAYDFEIAVRDINKGEQLTDDYGYLNISSPFKGIDEGTKRKIVYPDDLLKYHSVWDKKIKNVFYRIKNDDQPLKPILKESTWNKIERILKDKDQLDSMLLNYYSESSKA